MHVYYNILYIFFRICFKIGIFTFQKKETIIDIDNKYINPIKKKFIKNLENNEKNFNENIESIFYNKNEYFESVSESDNKLEKKWKTRIIFENTSRGNIIMYYDAYKMGFSYYSDQKTISYEVLNAIAMKYVSIFRCIDFFIDETITTTSSPFIKLYLSNDDKSLLSKSDKSTFVKAKNYSKNNTIFSKLPLKTKNNEETLNEMNTEKMKNKFLYLGKIQNFKITQNFQKKNKILSKFTSPLLEKIKLDSNIKRESITFSEFKKLKNMNK